jgi:uncharacterized protein
MNVFEKTIFELREDLNDALRGKDETSKIVIRQMISSLEYGAIAQRRDLNQLEITEIISREVKRYKEAYEASCKSERDDLMTKTLNEFACSERFLPPPLSEEDVRAMIADITHEVLANSIKDMPQVMKVLMPRIKGQFDGKRAKELVEEILDQRQIL